MAIVINTCQQQFAVQKKMWRSNFEKMGISLLCWAPCGLDERGGQGTRNSGIPSWSFDNVDIWVCLVETANQFCHGVKLLKILYIRQSGECCELATGVKCPVDVYLHWAALNAETHFLHAQIYIIFREFILLQRKTSFGLTCWTLNFHCAPPKISLTPLPSLCARSTWRAQAQPITKQRQCTKTNVNLTHRFTVWPVDYFRQYF